MSTKLQPIFILFSIIQQFSGGTVIRGYVLKIFGQLFLENHTTLICHPIPLSAYLSAIIIGMLRLVSSLCLSYLLVFFRRRMMYLTSACGSILSLGIYSTTLLLLEHQSDWNTGISQTMLSWSSLVSASCIVFSANLGVQPMPLLMSSELYPSDVRALCKGISRALTCLFTIISLKLFPILEKHLHLSGSFYFYCGVILCGLPIVMLVLPETKDLSMNQITRLFRKEETKKSVPSILLEKLFLFYLFLFKPQYSPVE